MLRPDREHHAYDYYDAAVRLAREGYGHEDIVVMLQLERTPKLKAVVRRIVLGIRAEYRGWLK